MLKIMNCNFDSFKPYSLSYTPPYDWTWMIKFLAERNPGGVEWIDGERYTRTVAVDGAVGIVELTQGKDDISKNALTLKLSQSLDPHREVVIGRIRHLFDLDFDPAAAGLCLGPLASAKPGLRVPGAFDPFESAVRSILGQLVSVQSASTFMCRYLYAFGEKIETPLANLSLVTPTAAQMALVAPDEVAARVKIPGKRAEAIINLANAIASGAINLENCDNPEETIAALEALSGIGPWTAHVIAMRILHWPDAFPHGDLGVRKAMKLEKKKAILEASEKWRPWRSYAAMHLWYSLGVGQ